MICHLYRTFMSVSTPGWPAWAAIVARRSEHMTEQRAIGWVDRSFIGLGDRIVVVVAFRVVLALGAVLAFDAVAALGAGAGFGALMPRKSHTWPRLVLRASPMRSGL